MPFYDLYCPACDKEYNIRASMTQKSEKLIFCPDCGSPELETVFKTPPAYIKGGKADCPRASVCGSGGSCRHAG
jgi:putative FmdB family regulatory protein